MRSNIRCTPRRGKRAFGRTDALSRRATAGVTGGDRRRCSRCYIAAGPADDAWRGVNVTSEGWRAFVAGSAVRSGSKSLTWEARLSGTRPAARRYDAAPGWHRVQRTTNGGFGHVPPLRSGPGCARGRQRYDCCQPRRAAAAPGARAFPRRSSRRAAVSALTGAHPSCSRRSRSGPRGRCAGGRPPYDPSATAAHRPHRPPRATAKHRLSDVIRLPLPPLSVLLSHASIP